MKILTIGELIVEIIATSKGDGFLEAQPLIGPFPSGAPAIFIDQVGKLATPCALISRVGDDDFGRLNIKRLSKDGVDISGIAIAPDETTGSAFVRYREDGSRKFVFNIKNSACGRLPYTPSVDQLLKSATHLHLMGTALAVTDTRKMALDAATRIHARGGSISFDPNLRTEMMDAPEIHSALHSILDKTDVFLPSGDELYLLTEAQDEHSAVDELFKRGIRAIVLKRGKSGATYFSRTERFDAAPIAVEEIDPTGAGDAFGGCFISFWANGSPPKTALRYANAAGARAVTCTGPMEGTSSLAELDHFLRQHT